MGSGIPDACIPVQPVLGVLCLMSSDYSEQISRFEEGAIGRVREVVRESTVVVVNEKFRGLLPPAKPFERIEPGGIGR